MSAEIPEELRKDCDDVLKGGLTMLEGVEKITTEYEGEIVEDAFAHRISKILEKTEDPMRQRRIIGLTAQIGDKLGSEKLIGLAQNLSERWKNG